MAKKQTQASKASVQTTELNRMPVPGADDTEFSAEEAAQAFQGNKGKSRRQ